MKLLITALLLSWSYISAAQPFNLGNGQGRVDLNLCQENHNLILRKFISQTDSQIGRLLKGLEEEASGHASKKQIQAYRNLLRDVTLKRIILSELRKQVNRTKLQSYFEIAENHHKDYLHPQNIDVHLEHHFKLTLNNVISSNRMNLAQDFLDEIRDNIIEDMVKSLIEVKFTQFGSSVFTQLASKTSKAVATKGLGNITFSFGSKVFLNAAKGVGINLLTMPLHAYRLPPETEWTDLLNRYPELILVPEWMRHGGIQDQPWFTHCLAIQRRTKQMEKRLMLGLQNDERDFINSIISIHHMREKKLDDGPKSPWPDQGAKVDNTYVKKPVMKEFHTAPAWAHL